MPANLQPISLDKKRTKNISIYDTGGDFSAHAYRGQVFAWLNGKNVINPDPSTQIRLPMVTMMIREFLNLVL